MEKEGVWSQTSHCPYSHTVTAAGHASLSTGTSPYKHGIIANDWYDRKQADLVSCVRTERFGPVPPAVQKPSSDKKTKPVPGASPHYLMVPTLAEIGRASCRERV